MVKSRLAGSIGRLESRRVSFSSDVPVMSRPQRRPRGFNAPAVGALNFLAGFNADAAPSFQSDKTDAYSAKKNNILLPLACGLAAI
jgi:hypothetical protein